MKDKSFLQRGLEIREGLQAHFPSLSVFENEAGLWEIAGSFPVLGERGKVLDRYDVSIILPLGFPKDLPAVREVSGRIPWVANRHVESNGDACVMLPDDRWWAFPEGATIIDYLTGPVHNFFFGQSYWEIHEKWPFGEWLHGADGVLQYYRKLIGTEDDQMVRRFLFILKTPWLKGHWTCPCGSNKRVRVCCSQKISELQMKISSRDAAVSYARLSKGAAPSAWPSSE